MARGRKPKSYNDEMIAELAMPAKGRRTYSDTDQRYLYIRVSATGARVFWVAHTRPTSKKLIWVRIGDSAIGIETARIKAREVIKSIIEGTDLAGAPDSFAKVAEDWFKRKVEKNGLRSAQSLRRILDNHLLPALGEREFTGIKRKDVAALQDAVEDSAGAVAADSVLSTFSNIANWYATRNDDYASPIIRGMRRTSPKERARDRILNDHEIRAVWKQAEANGTFGALVRLLLLTGQRRDKVVGMQWDDVGVDGIWRIPSEKREKGNAGDLPLPEMALAIIKAQARSDSPYVLAGAGTAPYQNYAYGKELFDAKVVISAWRLHDLRRTARSLMSRAGVNSDHAERVLGHVQQGVKGTYDRHPYRDEKGRALLSLAGEINMVLNELEPQRIGGRTAELSGLRLVGVDSGRALFKQLRAGIK